ncbi:hypothetical protein GCM10011575_27830 [Microlunatus endophyticus]|uniref:Uncharacterized protein n=1 Tax=Microlunatus endophyticus TaxID=1716077 RepID=A0A917W6A0_9ACTN|nr:hypothetical protein [Microlunatus endophyticus]GGL67736.1 hypothetical protein GCM10011575_27830 [Microlunatus endophyticus]
MTESAAGPAGSTTAEQITAEQITTEQIVTGLLAAAQLTPSAEEKAQMIKDFPKVRAGADALYLPELEFVEPATRFDPARYYTA